MGMGRERGRVMGAVDDESRKEMANRVERYQAD